MLDNNSRAKEEARTSAAPSTARCAENHTRFTRFGVALFRVGREWRRESDGPGCRAVELGQTSQLAMKAAEGLNRRSVREAGEGGGGGMRESSPGKNLEGHLVQLSSFSTIRLHTGICM